MNNSIVDYQIQKYFSHGQTTWTRKVQRDDWGHSAL